MDLGNEAGNPSAVITFCRSPRGPRNFSVRCAVTVTREPLATPYEEDERALVEAAQANPAFFVELYDRHVHRVWAFVVRRTSNRAEAEDVTSDVFRKALEYLPRYESRGAPFVAWLLRIAANTLADRWHKAARESGTPAPEVAEDEDLERRAMLFQLIERLPDMQRRVIAMRFVEGRSVLEVAQTLGTSEGAVKQLQRRALDSLRAEWEASHA